MTLNKLPEVHSWKIQELYDNFMNLETSTKHIRVPTFQRIRCWDATNKDKLIDSIKHQFPFGEVVLNKIGICRTNDKIEEFIVLDGLQRISTIIEYYTYPLNPNSFPGVRNNVFKIFEQNIKFLHEEQKIKTNKIDVIIQKVFEFYNKKSYFDLTNISTYMEYLKMLNNNSFLNDRDDVKEIFAKCYEKVINEIRLNDMMVAVRICFASPAKAYEIFNRLNTTGIKLEKWQIYAACWCEYPNFEIQNLQIVQEIINYYNNKKDNLIRMHGSQIKINNEIIPYNDKNNTGYNVFEYIVGLFGYLNNLRFSMGNYEEKSIVLENIAKKHVSGGNKTKDVYVGEKFIIRLLSEIFCCSEQDVGRKISEHDADQLNDLETNLYRSIKYLNPLFIKLRKSASASLPLHQEMICIIVETYNRIKDSYTLFKKNQQTNYNKLLLNMIYLKSIDCWSVSNIKNYLSNLPAFFTKDLGKPFNGYYGDIDMTIFKESIIAKIDKINNKTQKRRAVTGFVKLFLFTLNKFVYPDNDNYEIDHIIPLKQVTDFNQKNGEQLCVNHIGNLCCLSKVDNKSKGNSTIFSHYKRNKDTDFYKNILNIVYLSNKETENYATIFTNSNNNFSENYNKFVNKRKTRMINMLCDVYKDCFC